MTWHEAQLSLELATHLRVGVVMRLINEMQRAREDAAFAALKAASDGPS